MNCLRCNLRHASRWQVFVFGTFLGCVFTTMLASQTRHRSDDLAKPQMYLKMKKEVYLHGEAITMDLFIHNSGSQFLLVIPGYLSNLSAEEPGQEGLSWILVGQGWFDNMKKTSMYLQDSVFAWHQDTLISNRYNFKNCSPNPIQVVTAFRIQLHCNRKRIL